MQFIALSNKYNGSCKMSGKARQHSIIRHGNRGPKKLKRNAGRPTRSSRSHHHSLKKREETLLEAINRRQLPQKLFNIPEVIKVCAPVKASLLQSVREGT